MKNVLLLKLNLNFFWGEVFASEIPNAALVFLKGTDTNSAQLYSKSHWNFLAASYKKKKTIFRSITSKYKVLKIFSGLKIIWRK